MTSLSSLVNELPTTTEGMIRLVEEVMAHVDADENITTDYMWEPVTGNGYGKFFWEDYWLENEELVKRMLSVKLGKGDPNGTVYARNTYIKQVPNTEVASFLNKNHLQGNRLSTAFYGLYSKSNDELVSILGVLISKGGPVMEISRFASGKQVVGGFSKLLAYAEKQYPMLESVFTYSDNSISVGDLYAKNGFVMEADDIKAYFYAVNQKRVHRLRYTKKRFQTDPALKYREGLTETELVKLNNLTRIWDEGNTRWVKRLVSSV